MFFLSLGSLLEICPEALSLELGRDALRPAMLDFDLCNWMKSLVFLAAREAPKAT